MRQHFPDCQPLPGAETLVPNLSRASSVSSGAGIELALASNTKTSSFALKTSGSASKRLLDFFPPERRVLGDDPRLRQRQGRAKPAPDIYLIALESLNSATGPGESSILPSECLIFEESVAGVEAARRAGMRAAIRGVLYNSRSDSTRIYNTHPVRTGCN